MGEGKKGVKGEEDCKVLHMEKGGGNNQAEGPAPVAQVGCRRPPLPEIPRPAVRDPSMMPGNCSKDFRGPDQKDADSIPGSLG